MWLDFQSKSSFSPCQIEELPLQVDALEEVQTTDFLEDTLVLTQPSCHIHG